MYTRHIKPLSPCHVGHFTACNLYESTKYIKVWYVWCTWFTQYIHVYIHLYRYIMCRLSSIVYPLNQSINLSIYLCDGRYINQSGFNVRFLIRRRCKGRRISRCICVIYMYKYSVCMHLSVAFKDIHTCTCISTLVIYMYMYISLVEPSILHREVKNLPKLIITSSPPLSRNKIFRIMSFL